MINARHANAPFTFDSSDHCQRWYPHVHHQDVEEFLGRCRGHTRVLACRGVTCQQRWNVCGQQRHVAFRHEPPLAPFVLLPTED